MSTNLLMLHIYSAIQLWKAASSRSCVTLMVMSLLFTMTHNGIKDLKETLSSTDLRTSIVRLKRPTVQLLAVHSQTYWLYLMQPKTTAISIPALPGQLHQDHLQAVTSPFISVGVSPYNLPPIQCLLGIVYSITELSLTECILPMLIPPIYSYSCMH